MDETMRTILHRHAIRHFDEKQLDEERLQQILIEKPREKGKTPKWIFP